MQCQTISIKTFALYLLICDSKLFTKVHKHIWGLTCNLSPLKDHLTTHWDSYNLNYVVYH